MRGQLTAEIVKKAKSLGLDNFTQRELRLIPYVQWCVTNDENINPARIDKDERKILSKWREEDLITGGANNLNVSKDFWDAMCELIWLGYVDYEK